MPDVTPAIRSEILSELESARQEFVAARDTTGMSTHYMDFGLADTTLAECVAAIGKLTDPSSNRRYAQARLRRPPTVERRARAPGD
jgi:hypothetical protein